MRYLDCNKSVREFNEDLKEGLEHGFILDNIKDLKLMSELLSNLNQYFKYFIYANENKKINNSKT